MIFLTLGTQLPFDRLVETVDGIAPMTPEAIFGQIGPSSYTPDHFEYVKTLTPDDFNAKFTAARVIIGHAGIGTVLAGFKFQKPLVLMPRRAAFGEHRNDHQLATAAQISGFKGIYVVEDADHLLDLLTRTDLKSMVNRESPARDKLIAHIKTEIFG